MFVPRQAIKTICARPTAKARTAAAVLAGIGAAVLAGCNHDRSVLDPVSPQAQEVGNLWWIFFGVVSAVFVLVVIFLLVAIFRTRSTESPVGENTLTQVVTGAVVLTTLILLGLLLADFFTQHSLPAVQGTDVLTIKITGHQWWWRVEYQDALPSNVIETANEIHLPVGRPVQFILQSNDVIHSFWLPNLHGKKDLIPGHPTSVWFQPDRIGTFTGQCAEFCGYQHAHMGLQAIVESREDFSKWQDSQRQSAREPGNEKERQGQQVFLTRSCVLCHTIGGTPAGSRVGPVLTHFASQRTFAAGSFPNTYAEVKAWVHDPQSMKPGVRMPATPLSASELDAVVEYLRSLK
jgi:cytochrome c oxidase subunit II